MLPSSGLSRRRGLGLACAGRQPPGNRSRAWEGPFSLPEAAARHRLWWRGGPCWPVAAPQCLGSPVGGPSPGAPKGAANVQWPPHSGSKHVGPGCVFLRPWLLLTRGPGWRPPSAVGAPAEGQPPAPVPPGSGTREGLQGLAVHTCGLCAQGAVEPLQRRPPWGRGRCGGRQGRVSPRSVKSPGRDAGGRVLERGALCLRWWRLPQSWLLPPAPGGCHPHGPGWAVVRWRLNPL